ncbi:MAG: RNA ligase family protein [Clostridia bacterium]|nr:RNA ligase family protein [Clostridia bacterium]
MITFYDKNIVPMKLNRCAPFDSDDYIFEVKFDGARCLAYLNGKTQLINKRFKDVTSVYPELSQMHKCAKERCIIDGELVAFKDGVPDFATLMKRSLLTDSFKIAIRSKKIIVHFAAFDILFIKDEDITRLPLLKRKKILQENIQEDGLLTLTRYIRGSGIKYFELAKSKKLEGVIAKHIDSEYQAGKRSDYWFKIKNMEDEDFIICGFTLDEEGGIKYLLLGQYDGDELFHTATVYTPKKFVHKAVLEFAANNTMPRHKNFSKEGIYIKPQIVCNVEYMAKTKSGAMRQSIFKGLKDDVNPLECIVKK